MSIHSLDLFYIDKGFSKDQFVIYANISSSSVLYLEMQLICLCHYRCLALISPRLMIATMPQDNDPTFI